MNVRVWHMGCALWVSYGAVLAVLTGVNSVLDLPWWYGVVGVPPMFFETWTYVEDVDSDRVLITTNTGDL